MERIKQKQINWYGHLLRIDRDIITRTIAEQEKK